MTVLFDADRDANRTRQCGDCQLCCKLVPVEEIDKKAGVKCPAQKFKVGCRVYNTDRMPMSCKFWSCRWLVNDDTADLHRPDRSHVVIDIMPDYVTATDNNTGVETKIEVVQLWVDPAHPDAWKDPTVLAYLERRAEEGIVGLVRYNSGDGFTVVPPSMSGGQGWLELRGTTVKRSRGAWLDLADKYSPEATALAAAMIKQRAG